MKKTLTINLNGTVFNIDEDAYAALKSYLSDVEKHLPADDSQEIMNDIEARIAELFSDKLRQGKTVVTLDDVNFIIEIMGKPSQYADVEDTNDEKPSDEKEEKKKSSRRFYRDPEKAILGGICAGLEAYTGIDKVLWRIAMIVLTFVGWGLIIPIYFLIWLISPKAVTVAQRLEMSGKDVTIENIKDGFTSAKNYMESDEFKSSAKSIGQRLGEVCMFCFKLVGGFFGVIFGIVGFAILAALIALLVAVIAEPSLSPEFFTGFTAENAIMMLISILLVVGCPIFSIIYGVIRLLTKDKARSAVPQWISLILWLAGLFMLISTAIKSELSPANFKHYNIE
ncbi:MAG: PspC domain-containing protein, partial [Paludibacter sp.]|nr:PspC domain-containing protein [Paludibacter sp.]